MDQTVRCLRKYYEGVKLQTLFLYLYVVVVVVVFTLTDRASTIPSNKRGCQSGTWSQRGIKVNGSHHGDNPLLRPTGIQIATKRYATLQTMAPTNSKTVHQTSFTPCREQPRSTRIVVAYPRPAFSATNRTNTFQPVLINNYSKFLKATHRTKIRKIEISRSMVVEALSCWSRRASQHPAVTKPCASLKKPHESCPFAAPCGPRRKCSYRVMNVRRSYLRIRFNTSWTNHVRACGEV